MLAAPARSATSPSVAAITTAAAAAAGTAPCCCACAGAAALCWPAVLCAGFACPSASCLALPSGLERGHRMRCALCFMSCHMSSGRFIMLRWLQRFGAHAQRLLSRVCTTAWWCFLLTAWKICREAVASVKPVTIQSAKQLMHGQGADGDVTITCPMQSLVACNGFRSCRCCAAQPA